MTSFDSTALTRQLQEALQVLSRDCRAAFPLANQVVTEARGLGEAPLLGRALRVRAMCQGSLGELAAAQADFREALALARAAEEVELEGQCLHGLAVALFHLGETTPALTFMTEAVAIRRMVNLPGGLLSSLNSLAAFHGSLGHYAEAITCLTEARELTRRLGGAPDEPVILTNIALVYVELGQPEEALPFFEEAALLYDKYPDESNRCNTLLNHANTLRALGRSAEALMAAQEAAALAQRLANPAFLVKTLAVLGASQPDPEQAWQTLQSALHHAEACQLQDPLALVHQALGGFLLKKGSPQEARPWLERALAVAQAQNQLYTQSQLHFDLCLVFEALGEPAQALCHHRAYHALYAQLHHASANHRIRSQRAHYEAEQVRLEAEELRRQALEDPLTQLYNRRYLSQYLESEIVRSRRHGLPLCLILIDIDNFKSVNDHFSHQMGDQVLKTLAGLLREVSRGSDIVVRQAGDEFVVVTPETPLASACILAERLHEAIQAFSWETLAAGLKVTISIGVADLLSDDDLLDRADRQLYAAKHAGKNRICAHEPVSAGKTTEKLNC